MTLSYTFSSVDAAEAVASVLRQRLPLLHSVSVQEEETPLSNPEFAVFPIPSLTTSGFVGNYYPTLHAFNAMVNVPSFQNGLLPDAGELSVPGTKREGCARLSVCCEQQDQKNVEAIVNLQSGAESVS